MTRVTAAIGGTWIICPASADRAGALDETRCGGSAGNPAGTEDEEAIQLIGSVLGVIIGLWLMWKLLGWVASALLIIAILVVVLLT
jgi:hypothetical protein